MTAATSLADCRSKSISYGVNIRGAGEVPSLRLSKAIEGVAEMLAPPLLEVPPVSLSEFMELLLRNLQLGGVRLASQTDRANDVTSLLLDPTAQIGQRAALPDEVVHHHVLAVPFDLAIERSLPGEATIAVGTSVADDIGLHDIGVEWHPEALAQQLRQRSGNRIDAFAFVGVGTDEHRLAVSCPLNQHTYGIDARLVDQGMNELYRSHRTARFCRGVLGVLSRLRFGREQDCVREVLPPSDPRRLLHRLQVGFGTANLIAQIVVSNPRVAVAGPGEPFQAARRRNPQTVGDQTGSRLPRRRDVAAFFQPSLNEGSGVADMRHLAGQPRQGITTPIQFLLPDQMYCGIVGGWLPETRALGASGVRERRPVRPPSACRSLA